MTRSLGAMSGRLREDRRGDPGSRLAWWRTATPASTRPCFATLVRDLRRGEPDRRRARRARLNRVRTRRCTRAAPSTRRLPHTTSRGQGACRPNFLRRRSRRRCSSRYHRQATADPGCKRNPWASNTKLQPPAGQFDHTRDQCARRCKAWHRRESRRPRCPRPTTNTDRSAHRRHRTRLHQTPSCPHQCLRRPRPHRSLRRPRPRRSLRRPRPHHQAQHRQTTLPLRHGPHLAPGRYRRSNQPHRCTRSPHSPGR